MFYFLPIATAYADNGSAAGGTSGWGMIPMLVVFALIFYFLILRPQQKNAKAHKQLLTELKKDDQVILTSGIHGRVSTVSDDTVMIEVADNVRIKVSKAAVSVRKA